MVSAYNPSKTEVEAGSGRGQGQPQLLCKSEASLGYDTLPERVTLSIWPIETSLCLLPTLPRLRPVLCGKPSYMKLLEVIWLASNEDSLHVWVGFLFCLFCF